MISEERNIMQQHIAYLKEYTDKEIMLIFGTVPDPKRGFWTWHYFRRK